MKKPAIPQSNSTPELVLRALKENVEIIAGRRGTKIARIDTTNLTSIDLLLADKINEILDRLQD